MPVAGNHQRAARTVGPTFWPQIHLKRYVDNYSCLFIRRELPQFWGLRRSSHWSSRMRTPSQASPKLLAAPTQTAPCICAIEKRIASHDRGMLNSSSYMYNTYKICVCIALHLYKSVSMYTYLYMSICTYCMEKHLQCAGSPC